MVVPAGTGSTRSSPALPCWKSPRPWVPSPARWWGLRWYVRREAIPSSTRTMTLPPLPPLPPVGRPLGSPRRRSKATTPAPPLPPRRCTRTRSTNTARPGTSPRSVDEDVYEAALVALGVADGARGQGVERVVAPAADVEAGVDAGAALAHEDGAGVHELAVEYLGAESLRSRVAPVLAGTACLGLGHLNPPRRRLRCRLPPLLLPSSPVAWPATSSSARVRCR